MNVTVACGCGRTMRPAPLHGRGAFRCGCGAMVKIAETARNASGCVATADGGTCCRLPVTQTDPLALCDEHFASTGLKRYRQWLLQGPEEIALDAARLREIAFLGIGDDEATGEQVRLELVRREQSAQDQRRNAELRAQNLRRTRQEEAARESRGVVYFLQIGDLVKIGKSLVLEQRLASYSYPDRKLLATEPGYTERERQLHRLFAKAHHSGEWFRPTRDLLAYIAELNARQPIAG